MDSPLQTLLKLHKVTITSPFDSWVSQATDELDGYLRSHRNSMAEAEIETTLSDF